MSLRKAAGALKRAAACCLPKSSSTEKKEKDTYKKLVNEPEDDVDVLGHYLLTSPAGRGRTYKCLNCDSGFDKDCALEWNAMCLALSRTLSCPVCKKEEQKIVDFHSGKPVDIATVGNANPLPPKPANMNYLLIGNTVVPPTDYEAAYESIRKELLWAIIDYYLGLARSREMLTVHEFLNEPCPPVRSFHEFVLAIIVLC